MGKERKEIGGGESLGWGFYKLGMVRGRGILTCLKFSRCPHPPLAVLMEGVKCSAGVRRTYPLVSSFGSISELPAQGPKFRLEAPKASRPCRVGCM